MLNTNNTSATARFASFPVNPDTCIKTTASPQRHHHEITNSDEMDIEMSLESTPREQTSSAIGQASSFETPALSTSEPNTLEGQHQQANKATQPLKGQEETPAETRRPSVTVNFRLTASGVWKATYPASREPTAQPDPKEAQASSPAPPIAGVVKRGRGRPRKIRTDEETTAPKKKAAPKRKAAPRKAAATKPATTEDTTVNKDTVVATGVSITKDTPTNRGALAKKDAAAKATTLANDDNSTVADAEVEDPHLTSDKTSIPSTRVFGQGLKLKAARRIPRAEAPTSLFRAVPEVQHHRAPGRSLGPKQAAQPDEYYNRPERAAEEPRRYPERSPEYPDSPEYAGQSSEKPRVTPPWRKRPPPKFHPLPPRPSPPPGLESVSHPPPAMGERSKTQAHENQSSFWGPATSHHQVMIASSTVDVSRSFLTSVSRRNSIVSEGECTPSPSTKPKHPSATQPVATLSQCAATHSLAEGSRQESAGLERTPLSPRPCTSASTAHGTTPGSTFDLLAPGFMRRSDSGMSMATTSVTTAIPPSQQRLSSPIIGSISVLPSIEGGSPFVRDSAPASAVTQEYSLSLTTSSPALPSSQGHSSLVAGSSAVSSVHSSDSGRGPTSSPNGGCAAPRTTQTPISDTKGQETRHAGRPKEKTTPLPPWRDPNHISAKHRRMAMSNEPPQPVKSLALPPSLPRRPPGRLPDLPAAFRSGSHPTLITAPPAGFGPNQHRSSPYGFSPERPQQYQQGGFSHGHALLSHGHHQPSRSRYYGNESPSLGRGKGAAPTTPRPS